MLQAKTKEGKFVTLASLTRTEIAQSKKQEEFFCPTCNEQVIAKAGPMTIPHFAHRSAINCLSHEGGEGPYHEKGKLLLYQWLQRQGLQVELERHIPSINQRPDLLLTISHKKIAIEYQCARISIMDINKRNAGYEKAGITPIWILGANLFKRINRDRLKIDKLLLHFIHQFSPETPRTLYYFCPDTLQLLTFQHIYFNQPKQAIGKFQVSKLNQLSFTDLFQYQSFPTNKLYHLWKKEKQRFRLQQKNRLYGIDLAWYQWLYLKRTHREHLPSIIYLPVSGQYRMKTPLWDWQSRLCLEIVHPLPIGGTFSVKTCEQALRGHIGPANGFPLIKSAENPIQQYLQLLERLHVIKRLSPHHYQKTTSISFYSTVEEAIAGDTQVLNLLQGNVSKIQA